MQVIYSSLVNSKYKIKFTKIRAMKINLYEINRLRHSTGLKAFSIRFLKALMRLKGIDWA